MNSKGASARLSAKIDFPTLRDFLGCYYHQDAWIDHASHEEIWAEYLLHAQPRLRQQLQTEVAALLERDTAAIRKYVQKHADALMFRKSREYRTWADRFATWLMSQSSSNTSLERTREE